MSLLRRRKYKTLFDPGNREAVYSSTSRLVVGKTSFAWPNGECTIEFWNYHASNPLRNDQTLQAWSNASGERVTIHAPWSDAILYWDYGTFETGRLSVDYTPYLDKWTHIALYSAGEGGSLQQIYLNGVLVADDVTASDGPTTSKGLDIGKDKVGKMDEFRVWNVRRTQTQIKDNMNTKIAAQAGLIYYQRFDTLDFLDDSGNEHPVDTKTDMVIQDSTNADFNY